MKATNITKLILAWIVLFTCKACDKTVDEGRSSPYDPGKPVVLESFAPLEGGMATKVILSGQNFGNDPAQLKVYFNNRLANVIGCDKGKALVVTPRQPGDEVTISVVIGKDSIVYPERFIYHTRTTVTTLVGQKGSTAFKAGSYAEATFLRPYYITVDNELNLFFSHQPGEIIMVNQQNQMVQAIANNTAIFNVPSADADGEVIYFPSPQNNDLIMIDPAAQWAPKTRSILHPTSEEQAQGVQDFILNWKHSFAVNPVDKMMYTKATNGDLVKFDPITQKGELVAKVRAGDAFIQFHPTIPNLLYMAFDTQHAIYTYNLDSKQETLFAGTPGSSGWKDGQGINAQFSAPRQFALDQDGNLIVVDTGNHCIRQITPDGTVTTLIGAPNKKGYQDGNPDDAMFDTPRGVCIDHEGTIYIADTWNNCIRKLAIE